MSSDSIRHKKFTVSALASEAGVPEGTRIQELSKEQMEKIIDHLPPQSAEMDAGKNYSNSYWKNMGQKR